MTRILQFLYPNKIASFLCLIFISLLFSTPILFILDGINTDILGLALFLFFFCVFLTIVFFTFRSHGIQLFEKELFKFRINIKMILIVVGFQLFINVPFGYFLGKQTTNTYSCLLLFMMIGIAPILEEFIFRGVFLRALLSKYSNKKSILISSIIFALVHVKPLQMPGALFLGIYFGYIFTKTKSFSTTAILHIVANLSGVLGKQIFLLF